MKKLLLLFLLAGCFFTSKAQVLNTNFGQTNGFVYAVAVDSANNIVYVGGSFTQVNGLTRKHLAAMNLTTGALLSWNPAPDNDVTALYVYNNALYVGGQFYTIGGQVRKNVAKYYSPSGALANWAPSIDTCNSVYAFAAHANHIFVGGDILMLSGGGKQICELDTGTAVATTWTDYPNGVVQSLAIDGNTLFAGGNFTQIGSSPQNYIAKFYLSSSSGASFDPTWNPALDNNVQSLCAKSGRLFAGGSFSFVGSDNREKIAEIDTSSAIATSWNPGANNGVTDLEYKNGIIYPIGNFSVVGGKSRFFVGALDVVSGGASLWNAWVNATILDVAISGNQIFMGGSFSNVLGQNRSNFAVVCINPIDTFVNDPQGPATVCAGLSGVTYTCAALAGATSYSWSYNGTGVTTSGTGTVVTLDFSASATSGTLSVQATNGCESSNTVYLPISTYTFDANVSGNNSMTCGDSVSLSVSDNYQGSGSVSYTWTPSAGLNTTSGTDVRSGTKITRTYTATATSTEGCVSQYSIAINVSPVNVTLTAFSPNILCATSDTLYATNDYPGAGSVTYTWSPTSSLGLSNPSKPVASPVVTTEYTVTASSSDGCAASPKTITVVVDPISVTPGASPSSITCGSTTTLSASSDYPGTGTLSYTWSPSSDLSNANIVNPVASPTATTDYTLTVNSPEGCTSSNITTLSVDPLQVTVTNSYSVNCRQPVVLSTSANTSNPNLTYSWTPAAGLSSTTSDAPTATVDANTTYNVTMSLPASGCSSASNSINITLLAPATPNLCMVTVDSASTHNIIYWDKTGMSAVDSFRIYREINTNNYQRVGAVHYSALSEFHDYGADPNLTTYRYKLTVLDSCGNESPLSNFHNTIYIVSNNNGQYTWNPGYTIENSPNPVDNYVLMRDDNNTGSWHQVAITTGNQNTIVDPNYSSFAATANWQVATVWNISCTPTVRQSNGTMAAVVKSKSNISNNRTAGVKTLDAKLVVYPNPTNGILNIALPASSQGAVVVKITSLLGEEVYNETITPGASKLMVDMSRFQNGVYLVHVSDNTSSAIRRIVKN